jgi:DNA polymerase III epsilon subunit-like protein
MPSILFLDAETTGLPKRSPSGEMSQWPRAVTLAWAVVDSVAGARRVAYVIIRPDGFVIPADAVAVHGITQAAARRSGIPIETVLERLQSDITESQPVLMVGHNLDFDLSVIAEEFKRLDRPSPFAGMQHFCTMRETTALCRIPGPRGRFKWPRLEELHRHLFGREFGGAHNALDDMCVTVECYCELSRRGWAGNAVALQQVGPLAELAAAQKG